MTRPHVVPPGGARFDDLKAGRALLFPAPERVLIAETAASVAGVLAEVERACADGAWAFGYVSYEAAPGFDPALAVLPHAVDDDVPLAWFGVCGPPSALPPIVYDAKYVSVVPPYWTIDWSQAEHAQAVADVQDYIARGETYQCNLTTRLRAEKVDDPAALYAQMALAQQGAYNAYIDTGQHVVASASPELFFEWSGPVLRTRPMKGTAARVRTLSRDRDAARRLRSSPKERAENLMIVDLLRNDLARIARIGSVHVNELFTLEKYPTVWQLVSEVIAEPVGGVTLVDVFRALFPCGSVTGAPKASTMGIICDLEEHPRGVYCGAVGWVAPMGTDPCRARFNVAIRTAVVNKHSRTAVYGSGGAITWSSEASAEWQELCAKAAVLDTRNIHSWAPGSGRH